jgi:hypothetical protein
VDAAARPELYIGRRRLLQEGITNPSTASLARRNELNNNCWLGLLMISTKAHA